MMVVPFIIIILVTVLLLQTTANDKLSSDDEVDNNVPLFGIHDSPIKLGTVPKEEEPSRIVGGEEEPKKPSNTVHGKRQRQKQIRYLLRSNNNNSSGSGKWEELQRDGLDADSGGRWHLKGKVKVVIHGFSPPVFAKREQSIRKMHMFKIGDAYGVASGKSYNVIIVDWTSLSTEELCDYCQAALSTSYAGQDVANFLITLKDLQLIASWEDVHMIGFSLGAHVAGVAGAAIQRLSGGGASSKVGRITGIDPAGPLFEQSFSALGHVTRALTKTDANFVDVIHCNMGSVLTFAFARGKFGTILQSGHADFYPDGGESQKNCTKWQDEFEACSHIKCPLIFAQSITNYFAACPCQSWEMFKNGTCSCARGQGGGSEVAMGEECSKRAFGKYYRYM